jgi:hypothetical protein
MKILIYLIIFIISASCSLMERRDFAQEMGFGQLDQLNEPTFMPHRDFMIVGGDDGRDYRSLGQINSRTPATAKSREDMLHQASLERELILLENSLTDSEYYHYSKIRNSLPSISEKIYFLRLGARAKTSYLAARGFYKNNVKSAGYGNQHRMQSDILMGMSKSEVMHSWGRPMMKEVAGNPSEQNERWAYSRGGKIRYIYFEAGRVEGWTTQ